MSKFLVTGGAGFIGSHIVEHILSEGQAVIVLDNFSSGKEANLSFVNESQISSKQYCLIKDDIRDYEACLKACSGVDYVLHQAALRSVPKSMNNPYEYNEVNIGGTLNMLRAAQQCNVKRFIFASSSSIYGMTDKFPERETDYPLLISPYALTKLTGEFYCRIFSENFNLETVALRYFNVFGPRQAPDDEYAAVIPKFICCILKDICPPIFGNGKQSRDFTFVKDVVQANLLAAKIPDISGKVFNIASGSDNSIVELVAILNQLAGKSLQPEFLPERAGDVFKTLADISNSKKLLGFKPKFDFQQGLSLAYDWFCADQSRCR
ncbi:MAG: SDR family oxidoreductase [Candidatus Omnitrophota bacterium]